MTLKAVSRSSRGALRTSRRARQRGGTATVELAMVLPVFVMLLFGTLEIGLMARSSLALGQIGREAARAMSVGATPSRVQGLIGEISTGISEQRLSTSLQSRSWDEATGAWGSWTTLASDGVSNTAASGDQLRVMLTYEHLLATGGLLADVFDASDENTVALDATVVSVRE